MLHLKKLCNMVETIMVIIAFLSAIVMLPIGIRDEKLFPIIISISIFFFFWEHFFWHKVIRASELCEKVTSIIRRPYGKN